MGLFSSLGNGRNGPKQTIQCKTCGGSYGGTIDRAFPYAICGSCLDREAYYAKENCDNSAYKKIQLELRRRANTY